MRFIVISAILLTLVVCQFAGEAPEVSMQPILPMKTEHIRVDDEVIDRGDPWAVIEPVWWTMDFNDGETKYNKSLAPFSKEQRFLMAVNWYIAEVNNGGHDQFYFNSTGIVWKDALAGFREMGLDEAAVILEESAKRMGGSPSLDRETRWEQMDTYNPLFDDLDSRFYDLEDTVNLYDVMHGYIVQHRAAFYFEGDITMLDLPTYPDED